MILVFQLIVLLQLIVKYTGAPTDLKIHYTVFLIVVCPVYIEPVN